MFQASRYYVQMVVIVMATVIAGIVFIFLPRVEQGTEVVVFDANGKITGVRESGSFMPFGESHTFYGIDDWRTDLPQPSALIEMESPGAAKPVSNIGFTVDFEMISRAEAIAYYNQRIDEGDPVELNWFASLEQAVMRDVSDRIEVAWATGVLPEPRFITTDLPSIAYDADAATLYQAHLIEVAEAQALADAEAAAQAAEEEAEAAEACTSPDGKCPPPSSYETNNDISTPPAPEEPYSGPDYIWYCWAQELRIGGAAALSRDITDLLGFDQFTLTVPKSMLVQLRTEMPCGFNEPVVETNDETVVPNP